MGNLITGLLSSPNPVSGQLMQAAVPITQVVGNTLSKITPYSSRIISALSQIFTSANPSQAAQPGVSGPWRPPQYSKEPLFTVGVTDPNSGNQYVYIFDSPIRVTHEQRSVITMNPVQTGAAVSDHAYVIPARVTVEILMSDAMQAYDTSEFTGGGPKSVMAYAALVQLQEDRQVVSIATRLREYDQMLVAEVRAEEDKESRYALKAWVTFQEIITASVGYEPPMVSSGMPQTTGYTMAGQIPTTPPPPAVQSQNGVTGIPAALGSAFPSAGNYTSNSVSNLVSAFPNLGVH